VTPRTCADCGWPLAACPACGAPACRCKAEDGLRKHYWTRHLSPPAVLVLDTRPGRKRREQARELRRQGWSHKEIAEELGYGYVSSVAHATQGIKPVER
jgi:hypothetical protein